MNQIILQFFSGVVLHRLHQYILCRALLHHRRDEKWIRQKPSSGVIYSHLASKLPLLHHHIPLCYLLLLLIEIFQSSIHLATTSSAVSATHQHQLYLDLYRTLTGMRVCNRKYIIIMVYEFNQNFVFLHIFYILLDY